jgi:hypothetical protein
MKYPVEYMASLSRDSRFINQTLDFWDGFHLIPICNWILDNNSNLFEIINDKHKPDDDRDVIEKEEIYRLIYSNFSKSLDVAYNDFFEVLQKTVTSLVNKRYPIFLNFNSIDIGRNIAFSFAIQKFDSVFDCNSMKWEYPISKVLHLFVGDKNVNKIIAGIKEFPVWLCGEDTGAWWVRDDFAYLEYNYADIVEKIDSYINDGFKRSNDYIQSVVMNDETGSFESKQDIELRNFSNNDLTIFSCFAFIPVLGIKRKKTISLLEVLFTKYQDFNWIIIDEKKFNYSTKTDNLNYNFPYLKHINTWRLNFSYYIFDRNVFNTVNSIPKDWLK